MRTALSFIVLTMAGTASAAAQLQLPRCEAPDSQLRLDHIVVTVSELEVASATYRALGFALKEGRLHSNGLKNRHLEFYDGTEIELMSVVGEPGDEMARGYSEFLQGGEGGAYLALGGIQDEVLAAAAALGIEAAAFDDGGFRYVTFAPVELGNLFFVEYSSPVEDPESVLSHENGAAGIEVVWVEGAADLPRLLALLGAERCGEARLPDGRLGEAYGVSNGVIVVASPLSPRPRVVGVGLRSASGADGELREPAETHGIWLATWSRSR